MGTTPHPNRPRTRGAIRLALAAIVTAAVLAAGTLGARAFLFTEEDVAHYIECLRLMYADPPEHARLCLPYNGAPRDGSTLSPPTFSDAAPPPVIPPIVVPTVVPTKEPEPSVDCDVPDRGGEDAPQISEYCPPPS